MRKFPVIVALVLIIIGGVYALVPNLLPDNNRFPRIPTGDGTIGGAIAKILDITDLANYLGDGTVANTNMLSGVTANKLLKAQDICLAPSVWTGTDSIGKPVCGTNGSILASAIGNLELSPTCVGHAKAYHADGTVSTFDGGENVLQGDIIQTDAGCPVTIAFTDLSLIRLDGGSTVSLDTGVNPSSGENIARVILNNGGLWGRVLTGTGNEYQIGNDDIVAGVRGTSLSYEREGGNPSISLNTSPTGNHPWIMPPTTYPGKIKLIHSTQTGVTVKCRDGSTKFVGTGRLIQLPTSSPGGGSMCSTVSSSSMPTLYDNSTNSGIARNTAADLNYMVGLLYKSEYSTKYSRIQKEIDVTKPKDAATRNSVCPEASIIVNTYWDVFSGSEMGPCQSALAIANYADNTVRSANMYFSGGQSVSPGTSEILPITGGWIFDDGFFGGRDCDDWSDTIEGVGSKGPAHNILGQSEVDFSSFMSKNNISGSYSQFYLSDNFPTVCEGFSSPSTQWDKFKYLGDLYGIKNLDLGSPTVGINIPTTKPYISYPLPLLTHKIGSLAGKKVTIELGNSVGSITHIPAKYYVLDLGGSLKVSLDSGTWKCGWVTSPNPGVCRITGTTIDLIPSSTSLTVNLPMSINPTQMVVGNLWSPSIPSAHLQAPIGTTIKKISIQ